jgi:hypothetical protein
MRTRVFTALVRTIDTSFQQLNNGMCVKVVCLMKFQPLDNQLATLM